MLLYDCVTAPSPRRVRIFLAEKGISVPTRQVDLRAGEQFGNIFRSINSEVTVPVLELDENVRISDIIGICRYFEEIAPTPALFGRTPVDKALVEAWQRWSDREGFYATMDAFRNSTPGLKERALPGPDNYSQCEELATRSRLRIISFFARLDKELAKKEFLAGDAFSIADITAMVSVDFAAWIKIVPPSQHSHLNRWLGIVRARSSASA
jgi:glutathione S-transferase